MRKEYQTVFISNDPKKFEMRVTDSYLYSVHLEGNYQATDFINEQVLSTKDAMSKFFQDKVSTMLLEQFDNLCTEMHNILFQDEIQVETGV